MFQLTTSRRGRHVYIGFVTYCYMFQLTTSRRGRRLLAILLNLSFCVSTHDLTKRSTSVSFMVVRLSTFQLTTSRRGRRDYNYKTCSSWSFQLTTSRRGRLLNYAMSNAVVRRFNSRPHEEVDVYLPYSSTSLSVFQLTTSRRGRLQSPLWLCACRRFNSRPHEEVDATIIIKLVPHGRFNSRPHEEVDFARTFFAVIVQMFQLTTSRRGRRNVRGLHTYRSG